ncbi:isoprenoid synthase domain-containing protein [Xylariaceae sp. FL0016]|nr:isoprenoid synthase domain-containing protein [Xylariaceae sp. FL0016]
MKSGFARFVKSVRRALGCASVPANATTPLGKEDALSDTSSELPASKQGPQDDASTIAKQLHGQTLPLSDLTKVFADWPTATNKHTKELQVLVDSLLERIITNEKKLKALKNADFARLMSLWYPDSEWAELEVATAYSVWIFVWDDEIDAGDTDASHNEELARAYYKQSLNYIHTELGLDGPEQILGSKSPNQNMNLFGDVGKGLRDTTDVVQRKRFFTELENFMLQVGVEHNHRMAGSIPTFDEYMKIRSGSVGCGPQIAITDFMLKVRLPESVMESTAMKSLWRETIHICLILNDVYSVQKEIAQGSLLNIVPVMFKAMGSDPRKLDAVSRELEKALQESMERFESAASALCAMEPGQDELNQNIRDFIKWCRYFITGVLYWSLESRRYGMADCIGQDGTLSIVL